MASLLTDGQVKDEQADEEAERRKFMKKLKFIFFFGIYVINLH